MKSPANRDEEVPSVLRNELQRLVHRISSRLVDALRHRSVYFSRPLQWWCQRRRTLAGPVLKTLQYIARLDRLNGPELRVLQVVAISDLKPVSRTTLVPGGYPLCASPLTASGEGPVGHPPVRTEPFGEVALHEFRDVLLRGTRRTGFEINGMLALPDDVVQRGIDYPEGQTQFKTSFAYLKFTGTHACAPGTDQVLVQSPREVLTIPRGHYLGGFALDNWYHWITGGLFRAWIVDTTNEESEALPHLIPRKALRAASIRRSLVVLRRPEAVIELPDYGIARIRRLNWVTSFADNTELADPYGTPEQSAFHQDLIARYREALLAEFRDSRQVVGDLPRRVFIDRGPTGTREYNREEVLQVVERFGFTSLDPSTLSLEAQVALFQHAEAIVGPSGAAWTNILFASSRARALYWIPDFLSGTQTWATLAAASGVCVQEFTYPTHPDSSFFHDSYQIPIHDFASRLRDL